MSFLKKKKTPHNNEILFSGRDGIDYLLSVRKLKITRKITVSVKRTEFTSLL